MNQLPPFFQNHGGLLPAILVAFLCFNVVLSGIAQIFTILGKQEPAWLQTIGAIGLKVAQWLSGNTTPKPPVK